MEGGCERAVNAGLHHASEPKAFFAHSTDAPTDQGNCCGIICIKYRPASALERAQANGLIIKAVQDSIAFCPPLIITEEQVHDLVDRFVKSLDQVST